MFSGQPGRRRGGAPPAEAGGEPGTVPVHGLFLRLGRGRFHTGPGDRLSFHPAGPGPEVRLVCLPAQAERHLLRPDADVGPRPACGGRPAAEHSGLTPLDRAGGTFSVSADTRRPQGYGKRPSGTRQPFYRQRLQKRAGNRIAGDSSPPVDADHAPFLVRFCRRSVQLAYERPPGHALQQPAAEQIRLNERSGGRVECPHTRRGISEQNKRRKL